MLTNRVLILTGGTISETFAKDYLKDQKFDSVIAADSGLIALEKLELPVQYIVGDFDSVPDNVLEKYQKQYSDNPSVTIKRYNPIKDATDTQIAIELAIELNADEIVILGATGSRIDHLLANIHLLSLPLEKGIRAYIIDEHNKISLINQNTTLFKEQLYGPFISFLPLTEMVSEVTLQGFKYPLVKRTLHHGESIGVSNEVIESQASITLQAGILIEIESKD